MTLRLLLPLTVLSTVSAAFAADSRPTYELRFWPGPNAKSDSRVIQIVEHPCGSVAIARVKSLPPPKKGQVLNPERVVELSPRGEVVRRWAMPVDFSPMGVRGDSIVVQLGQSRLWLDLNGNISTVEENIAIPHPEAAQCDKLREFGNSAYARCWRYRDLQNGHPRVLAYEGVCT
jgi:hypothetical protein